jgi:shikimate kinase
MGDRDARVAGSPTPPPSPIVFLIGYRGSGKSSVGRELARAWGLPLIDTDREIERASGQTIRSIFESSGEAAFRDLESEILHVACDRVQTGGIVSTGGGAVLRPANVERMRATGRVVWLMASPSELRHRIEADRRSADDRPSLLGTSAPDEIEQVLAQRAPLYEAAAHLVIDTDGRSPAEVARSLESVLPGPASS